MSSALLAALILFGSFAVLLLIGVPISISLGISATAVIIFAQSIMSPATPTSIPLRFYAGLDSVSIMAIAFFVLAGNLMSRGGISRRIVAFANLLVGRVRGGMAIALVVACAFFAAISGSAPATVVAIGSMLYGDMIAEGYPTDKTAGLLVVSGGLGPIIPPSIIMVVYCTITNASVSSMFTQGMLVGIIIAVVLIIEVVFYAKKEQWPVHKEKLTAKQVLHTIVDSFPALLTPIIILGGIYTGILTPTESSAVACVWALIAGLFIYKELSFKDLFKIFYDSAKGSALVLFIIAASTSFSWVFTFSGLSKSLVSAVMSMNLSPTLYCFIVAIILLIFGTFMEGIAICVLLVPVLWPIAQSLGINVLHFGMIVCVSNVIGTMTPPVAVNIYSATSVTGVPMGRIAKAQLPFFIGYVSVFFLTVFFPWFSTCLVK